MITASRINRIIVFIIAIGLCAASANAGLIHRYSFKSGTTKDSVGKVDATLKGTAKIVDGKLVLQNGDKTSDDTNLSYLEFNSSILPASADAKSSTSLLIWITAKENAPFARVLDIGDKSGAEGQQFIYLVAKHEDDMSRAAITASDTGSKAYITGARLDDGKPHLAAIVIDGAAKKLHLYVDGKESEAQDLGDNTLDTVHPVHNWIGKSGFDADPGLSASFDEIRVYDTALKSSEIAEIYKAGPDALPQQGAK